MYNPVCSGYSAEIRAPLHCGQWSSGNLLYLFPSVLLISRMGVIISASSLSQGCLSHTHTHPPIPTPTPTSTLWTVIHHTRGVSLGKAKQYPHSTAGVSFLKHTSDVLVCPLQPHGGSSSAKRDLVIWLLPLLRLWWTRPRGLAMPTWFLVCASLCRPSEHLHTLSHKHSESFWVAGSEMCNQVLARESILGEWWVGNYSDFSRHFLKAQLCHQ